jgi:DNA-binding SARP family transcriptional activator
MASAAVYDGDFLPGFYEPWVVLERERLLAVFEDKMELLLDRLLAAERWTAVIGAAERWIALGATPEPAYRALMTAHDRLGHKSQVHAAYQRCHDSLAENIGLPPSAETMALYELLTQWRPTDDMPAVRLRPLVDQSPQADSRREMAELHKQLSAARALAEQERQIAEAHRRTAARSVRVMGTLALALAAAIGALARDRSQRRVRRDNSP